MTITTAQGFIDTAYRAKWITANKAQWYAMMIRRTEGYGHKWSWKRQKDMRNNLILDNKELHTV